MTKMLLDFLGDVPLQEGYLLVTSEIEFLKFATTDNNLQVRGSLCLWAESFCLGRGVDFRKLVSPQLEIQDICQGIDPDQAKDIYALLGTKKFNSLDRPLTVSSVLNAIFPSQLWSQDTSYNHAADWLLWLLDTKPEKCLRPLLQSKCDLWKSATSGVEQRIYSATDAEIASNIVEKWVGLINDPLFQNAKNFPRQIPIRIQTEARKKWNHLLIETRGEFLYEILSSPLHKQLKAILIEEAYQHLKKHKTDVSQEIFDLLSPLLGWQQQKDLQSLLPPAGISKMPELSKEVLEWFRNSYFPYRRWQYGNDDKDIRAMINEHARNFGLWYLSHYPEAISSGSMKDVLSFSKIVDVAKNSQQYVTLIVVLDGLHIGDAQTLNVKIQQNILRLSIVADNMVFTPLPTVTEFCKPSLFMGVPPNKVDGVSPIGEIIPEKEAPLSWLNNSKLGDVFLWRVQEPDRTYHEKGRADLVLRKVELELEKVIKDVSDIVDQMRSELPLQLIITTDHGRLIDSPQRRIPAPKEMNSHGRAAWGKANIDFNNDDFVVENDLAYLKGERYGMKYDIAVSLGEDAFLMSDGKSGKEHFPHGGVYPEEVIIPWITYIRDYVAPEVTVKISGNGVAGSTGNMQVSIINYGEIAISLDRLHIRFDNRKIDYADLKFAISESATANYVLEIDKWPTMFEVKNSKCESEFIQPNGLKFSVTAEIDLQSNEMYHSDSILEDLI